MIYENPLTGQFVRFVKGSAANWNRLEHKREDTLYFIINNDGISGRLYLGPVLVGSTSSNGSALALNDLADVLSSVLNDRDILVFNSTSNAWQTQSLDALLASAMANSNHLRYRIINSLNDIDVHAADADKYVYLVPKDDTNSDTYNEFLCIDGVLEKIGSWDVDLSNYVTEPVFEERVGSLEDAVATINTTTIPELNTSISELASIVNDPTHFVLQSVYNAEVGDLSALINSTGSINAPTLVEQVNNLTERLTWYDIQQTSE